MLLVLAGPASRTAGREHRAPALLGFAVLAGGQAALQGCCSDSCVL